MLFDTGILFDSFCRDCGSQFGAVCYLGVGGGGTDDALRFAGGEAKCECSKQEEQDTKFLH